MRTNAQKVQLLILSLLIFSVGCASPDPGKKLIQSLKNADPGETIIVGRVVTTPSLDDEGKVYPDPGSVEKPIEIRAVFTLCPTANRPADKLWDDDCDIQTVRTPTQQFFAIKVPSTKHFSWFTLSAVLENRNALSVILGGDLGDDQGEFVSFVRGFYIKAQGPLKPGQVYYVGTLNFHLGNQSFVETGDQEYDFEQALYVAPNDLTIHDELSDAKFWMQKSLGYDGPVVSLPLKLELNEMESSYVRHYKR